MTVSPCDIPPTSQLDHDMIAAAYFRDAYRAPLRHQHPGVIPLFHAIFAHHPRWLKTILIIRNKIASWCGLDAPTAAEIMNPNIAPRYRVGDKIGVWPIFALTDTELIAGRDNPHLDFRVSVLREGDSVVVSTICTTHNVFGKIYLTAIIPFHIWGVRHLLARAGRAGRL